MGLWVLALVGTALAQVPLDGGSPTAAGAPWWAGFLRDVGFPIAVAAYVLYRIEPAINELSSVIHEIHGLLSGHKGDE